MQVARIGFEDALDVGFRQPIAYGGADPKVVRETLKIPGDLGLSAQARSYEDAVRRLIGFASDVASEQAIHPSIRDEIGDLRAEALAVSNGEPCIPLHRTI